MKSTDANLTTMKDNQSKSDEADPSQLKTLQQLLTVLSLAISKKYDIKNEPATNFAQKEFKKLKELSQLNPDKVMRIYKIYPLNDENIYKYLIEKAK